MSRFFLEPPCDAVGSDEGRDLEQWLDKVAPEPLIDIPENLYGTVRAIVVDLCEAGFRGHIAMHPADFSNLVNHSMNFARVEPTPSGMWSMEPPNRDRIFLNVGRHEYQIRCDPRVARGTLTAVPEKRSP